MWADEDEDKCFLGKFSLSFYLSLSPPPSPPLVILLTERIKRAGLCVPMAMTSLCHFCDRLLRCKSAAEDCSHPPSPHYPFIGIPARQQLHSHLSSYQKSVLLLLLPPASLAVHTTQHHCEALWAVDVSACSVWNAMWFLGPTCFNCTVWCNWGKRC